MRVRVLFRLVTRVFTSKVASADQVTNNNSTPSSVPLVKWDGLVLGGGCVELALMAHSWNGIVYVKVKVKMKDDVEAVFQ